MPGYQVGRLGTGEEIQEVYGHLALAYLLNAGQPAGTVPGHFRGSRHVVPPGSKKRVPLGEAALPRDTGPRRTSLGAPDFPPSGLLADFLMGWKKPVSGRRQRVSDRAPALRQSACPCPSLAECLSSRDCVADENLQETRMGVTIPGLSKLFT